MNTNILKSGKKPSKLDKIRNYLFDDGKIGQKSLEALGYYKKIHGLLIVGYGRNQVLTLLQKNDFLQTGKIGLKQRQAYNLYNEAMLLLGDIGKVNKEAERYVSHEKYLDIAKKAEDIGDFTTALRARENADKVYGLFDFEEKSNDTSVFFQNVTITRSSNPEILKIPINADE